METRPEGLDYIGTAMSNYDHNIREDSEQKLKTCKTYGDYPGWNFHGSVWFDGCFKCQIKQYRQHVDTIESDTLQGIMEKACEKYGSD